MSITVLVGNPRPASRTSSTAVAAARAVASAAGRSGEPEVIELADLAPDLLLANRPARVADALERVRAAETLLVASPTYKATYTGLLKVFLDQFPADALAGAVAIPLLLVGSPAHTLAVEVHLRPLLVELGAAVPTPGLAVAEADLPRLPELLAPWARQVARQLPPAGPGGTAG
ncbi:NADPH-dependent FMN reductase [Marinitenerispora sediminis]|uniref:FMN reductase n=1 Tax=Marinitenerispora sediminis TaxID=1931232 RepID=A0A368SZ41_9ACTN|nr:NADPH-dependent FMN reductase [Marinitenerispora sediminis]RCV47872.1 FMN reductase [Marinitenerispora sediminis]RCV48728.1 FMN reductase [Marinitenerispora sediminis]RCV50484.1 FMN reductase [Marinitenerispora sediminis]